MNEFLSNFLAKNKYPDVKKTVIKTEMTREITWKQSDIDLFQKTKSKTNKMIFILTLNSLYNNDVSKAEQWGNQSVQFFPTLILLLISYIQINMTYEQFVVKYKSLIEKLYDMDLASIATDKESIYRFLRLLSGWVKDHEEYEFSQDLLMLSDENLKSLDFDRLINRWYAQDRKYEMCLLQFVNPSNQKLNHLLGIGDDDEMDVADVAIVDEVVGAVTDDGDNSGDSGEN
jgi:hypothetical protein